MSLCVVVLGSIPILLFSDTLCLNPRWQSSKITKSNRGSPPPCKKKKLGTVIRDCKQGDDRRWDTGGGGGGGGEKVQ
jgi:hypothetical protein